MGAHIIKQGILIILVTQIAVDIINNEIWFSNKKIKRGRIKYDYGYEFDKDDYKDHVCKCGSENLLVLLYHQMIGQNTVNT